MSKTNIPKKPILRFLDINASQVESYSSALEDMIINRSFEGMIIREVLPQETVERVVRRLEEDGGGMNSLFRSPSAKIENLDHKPPNLFGHPIVAGKPDLKKYFADAQAFRQGCCELFQGNPDFEERVESVLHYLSGGLPVRIPTGPQGQTYTSATIRVMPAGHEIKVHVGNEFLRMPQASHLRTMVDLSDQLSYFIPLSVPEAGGELIVYTLEWDLEERSSNTPAIHHLDDHVVEQYESMAFAPGPGDMLLFNGGRYYHRVTPVLGSRLRRTIGGFLAFSQEHDAVYYWS